MEGLEVRVTRPRQVRYQAALRPDCLHSTPLLDRARQRENRVLIQRTCFCGTFPHDCFKTTPNGINTLQARTLRGLNECVSLKPEFTVVGLGHTEAGWKNEL
jgi:hypothetical protein